METNKTNTPSLSRVKETEKVVQKKRISKAWKAAMKTQGSVEILDFDALFKPICY